MGKGKRYLLMFITLGLVVTFSGLIGLWVAPHAAAQYWQALPPYNVLWPLWSPPLSPVNPVTGVAAPLVTELTAGTVLPVQPALVWDPAQAAPWALYNTPLTFGGGLVYFDQLYGLNPWPPNYLQDQVTGSPIPISLIGTWSLLLPTTLGHLEYFIPLANTTYALTYGITGQPFLDLLTAAQIWGLPPI